MPTRNFVKAGLLSLSLVILFLACWEVFWRSKGYIPTYNDDKALWAEKRREVYRPANRSTVFIGSSRIKFDLDIPEWKRITGEEAVQLSLVGTSPLLLLEDLASDEKFKGKLVIDVTEVLFFSKNPAFHQSAKEAVAFYKKQTPAEKISAGINFALESQFTFLEERRFAMNSLLNELELENRPGVFSVPAFPKGFEWTTKDRQTYMSGMFLSSPADLKRQTDIWSTLIMGDKSPAVDGEELDRIFSDITSAVARIRARGGKVIFVRTPSSGPMEKGEQEKYPREKYWEQLLKLTHSEGIHYKDNALTAQMVCPEWSHLSPSDVMIYTHVLAKELREKGWFSN